MDNNNIVDEEKFKREFEIKVEQRKQWLLSELKASGKFLDVSAKKLDDLDALTIALYLHECTFELQLFHIGANSITDRGFIDMLTGLQWHDRLQEIYVGNNLITERKIGIQGLIEVCSGFKELRILSMSGCSIDDQTFIQLCYMLPELFNLKQLHVPINDIGDYGLICFSTLMATNQLERLSVLHFGGNPLSSKSLVPFFQAMRKNKTVKILYLNDIGMNIVTIKEIANCLRKNKTLEELNLGNTGFSDQAAYCLWPSLRHLKSLHLWNNHLTDSALLDLVSVLDQEDIALTYVNLADNNIEDQELIELVNSTLKQGERLEKLVQSQQPKKEQQVEAEEEEVVKEMIDLARVEEIEEKLSQLELGSEKQQEEQQNALQGVLKTKKWVGETQDAQDPTLVHSQLE